MGFIFPYGTAMRVVGGMLLLSTLVNALIFLRTEWGSGWYFEWSPIFLFVGLLMVMGSLWTDPKIVIFVTGIVAILWYVFIVLGWSM